MKANQIVQRIEKLERRISRLAVSHNERLLEELQDPELAKAFLDACLEEADDMPDLLVHALCLVAEAQARR